MPLSGPPAFLTASTALENACSEVLALLRASCAQYHRVAFAHSFGAEDMVLMDLIARHTLPITPFSLDTGRLPQETYRLMQTVRERYPACPVTLYFPATHVVEQYVNQHGIDAFYQSVALRKSCCAMRKLEPLRRALDGHDAWVVGLRREQSTTRENLHRSERDEANGGLMKISPLLDWTEAQVWAYLRTHQVPYNALHDQHYPSIGCAPCTRAIAMGEDLRAGRWWWENPDSRECGLHGRTG